MSDELTHTFSYQDEPESSFLKWAMLTFMPPDAHETKWIERASEATDHFSNVELKISFNGIEVDAERFMARLDEAQDDLVKRRVSSQLAELRPHFSELEDMIHDLTVAFNRRARSLAVEHGVQVDTEDWRA